MTTGLPIETLQLTTEDGVTLEAQVAVPPEPIAAAVICHPHPLYGGNMHNNVVAALFDRFPDRGVVSLRFNFRGVDGSGGEHDGGSAERLDIAAAIDHVTGLAPSMPTVLAGYSFGADVALAVDHQRLAGWLAVAPPLRVMETEKMVAGTDARPKVMITGSNDEFRPPDQLREAVTNWTDCRVSVADGASHFFASGLEAVIVVAEDFLAELTAGPG
jgi:alpha/beta superfamily hydrolase